MSVGPPAANGTIKVMGLVGYACAFAMRDKIGCAAAAVAARRNARREMSAIMVLAHGRGVAAEVGGACKLFFLSSKCFPAEGIIALPFNSRGFGMSAGS